MPNIFDLGAAKKQNQASNPMVKDMDKMRDMLLLIYYITWNLTRACSRHA